MRHFPRKDRKPLDAKIPVRGINIRPLRGGLRVRKISDSGKISTREGKSTLCKRVSKYSTQLNPF
jgi:hypothetical protein